MTDEERKRLCEWLRNTSRGWSGSSVIEPKMAMAADEIERLNNLLNMYHRCRVMNRADEIARLQKAQSDVYDKIKGHAVTQSNEEWDD